MNTILIKYKSNTLL